MHFEAVCVCVCVCVCQRKTKDRADGMREKSAHCPRRDSNLYLWDTRPSCFRLHHDGRHASRQSKQTLQTLTVSSIVKQSCMSVSEKDERQSWRHEGQKCPLPSMGFEPVPLGYAPTMLPITPRGQARLTSVETNTSDTHPPAPLWNTVMQETLQLLSAGPRCQASVRTSAKSDEACQRKTKDRPDGMREKSAHSPWQDSNLYLWDTMCVCACARVCVLKKANYLPCFTQACPAMSWLGFTMRLCTKLFFNDWTLHKIFFLNVLGCFLEHLHDCSGQPPVICLFKKKKKARIWLNHFVLTNETLFVFSIDYIHLPMQRQSNWPCNWGF